jgi:hypothetical protein
MTISEEIPFTSDALKIYIDEIEKEMDRLHLAVLAYGKLKTRLKKARERLEKR